jgi:hypothetical protein
MFLSFVIYSCVLPCVNSLYSLFCHSLRLFPVCEIIYSLVYFIIVFLVSLMNSLYYSCLSILISNKFIMLLQVFFVQLMLADMNKEIKGLRFLPYSENLLLLMSISLKLMEYRPIGIYSYIRYNAVRCIVFETWLRLILANIWIFLTCIRFISCLIYWIKHLVDAELLLQIFSIYLFLNFLFRCAVSGSGKITMHVLEKLIAYGALPITVSGTFSRRWIF